MIPAHGATQRVGRPPKPVRPNLFVNNLRYAEDTTLMAESEEELKSLLMKVKVESEKVGLKLNIQKMKIMASGPTTSWEIYGETVETVSDFIFLGSKITTDGDCSHEIKRRPLHFNLTGLSSPQTGHALPSCPLGPPTHLLHIHLLPFYPSAEGAVCPSECNLDHPPKAPCLCPS